MTPCPNCAALEANLERVRRALADAGDLADGDEPQVYGEFIRDMNAQLHGLAVERDGLQADVETWQDCYGREKAACDELRRERDELKDALNQANFAVGRERVDRLYEVLECAEISRDALQARVGILVEALQSVQHNRVCSCYDVLGAPCARCVVGYDDVDAALDAEPKR